MNYLDQIKINKMLPYIKIANLLHTPTLPTLINRLRGLRTDRTLRTERLIIIIKKIIRVRKLNLYLAVYLFNLQKKIM